jgi:hypothetical protein
VTPRVHSAILHEIVRVIDAHGRVPERVRVRGHEYQVAYIEDHKGRLEEAIRRHDADRLNMLYGQLASKVKYQLLSTPRSAPSQPRGLFDERPVVDATGTASKGGRVKKSAKMAKKALATRGAKVWMAAKVRG